MTMTTPAADHTRPAICDSIAALDAKLSRPGYEAIRREANAEGTILAELSEAYLFFWERDGDYDWTRLDGLRRHFEAIEAAAYLAESSRPDLGRRLLTPVPLSFTDWAIPD